MAWLPYVETKPPLTNPLDTVASTAHIVVLLEATILQLELLNARVEEAFETRINEEDIA